jgi:ABC-2 type transport system ATP-binding protein
MVVSGDGLMRNGTMVSAQNLCKSFRLPDHGPRRTRERLMHPVRRARPHELAVLDGISFEVRSGELFGIVGPNGSGKSTLLRLLAGIYQPDGGRLAVRGTVGPFLELGVGFNPELSARQNVVLNGVMMGLPPSELRRRLEEILRFAEVQEFADLQLKHFSSGMRVRLAFAVMVQADPEIYLIDEVLAVGDPAFRERCAEVFAELRDRGKTIVLVSQQTSTIERQCDRAMLLAGGKIEALGDPKEVTQRYLELNLESGSAGRGGPRRGLAGHRPARRTRATIVDLWIGDEDGTRRATVDEGEPIDLHAVVEVEKRIRSAGLRLELRNERGARIFTPPDREAASGGDLMPGARCRARVTIENPLPPGRYSIICAVVHGGNSGRIVASPAQTVTFEIAGERRPGAGLVSLDHTITMLPERAKELTA